MCGAHFARLINLTYRISLIRNHATIIFSMQVLGATVQGQRFLEGSGNKLQVPVDLSYFGKGSLHHIIIYHYNIRGMATGLYLELRRLLEGGV